MNIKLFEKVKLWAENKFETNSIPGVIGIRGFDENFISNDDKLNDFNDTLFVTLDNKIIPFNYTADPGSPYILKPINPNGTARIEEGSYKVLSDFNNKKITHFGHPAFRIFDPVFRQDFNKNGSWDLDEKIKRAGLEIGIDFHWKSPGGKVGWSSAGCQVINSPRDGKEWIEFYILLSKFKSWNYILLDQSTVKNIIG